MTLSWEFPPYQNIKYAELFMDGVLYRGLGTSFDFNYLQPSEPDQKQQYQFLLNIGYDGQHGDVFETRTLQYESPLNTIVVTSELQSLTATSSISESILYYSFDVDQNDIYYFECQNASLSIKIPDTNSPRNVTGEHVVWSLNSPCYFYYPTQNRYYLAVSRPSERVNDGEVFTLKYKKLVSPDNDDQKETGNQTTFQTQSLTLSGKINQPGDQDWFRFEADTQYAYEIQSIVPNGVDQVEIDFFQSDGTKINTITLDTSTSTYIFQPSLSGVYYFRVSDFTHLTQTSPVSDYQLTYRKIQKQYDTFDTAANLIISDTPASQNVYLYYLDTNYYKVTLSHSKKYFFQVINTDTNLSKPLVIYDANGVTFNITEHNANAIQDSVVYIKIGWNQFFYSGNCEFGYYSAAKDYNDTFSTATALTLTNTNSAYQISSDVNCYGDADYYSFTHDSDSTMIFFFQRAYDQPKLDMSFYSSDYSHQSDVYYNYSQYFLTASANQTQYVKIRGINTATDQYVFKYKRIEIPTHNTKETAYNINLSGTPLTFQDYITPLNNQIWFRIPLTPANYTFSISSFDFNGVQGQDVMMTCRNENGDTLANTTQNLHYAVTNGFVMYIVVYASSQTPCQFQLTMTKN